MLGPQKQIVGDILEEIQRKALNNEPITHYIKTIRGRLAVQVLDPFTGVEVTRVLKGDTADKNADLTEAIVPLFTDYDLRFFERQNRNLIELGLLALHNPNIEELQRVNAITEEEVTTLVTGPFLTLKARLGKFTTTAPVERLLNAAKEHNRPIRTIETIEVRLADLQK